MSAFMTHLGSVINSATTLMPVPMGIAVATLMGMTLSSPISSAAIAISLNMSGLAAGAATVGCSAQMMVSLEPLPLCREVHQHIL
ncbi:PTS sugar transporter subunit IIC [Clostridium estertheticum]|uniref:PTS sugar transporter subunit IIC n=1 Tax=Clostridium estertheticum TaxID=238834 RepID=UPI0027147D8A|nr:PTS sugar transporter subunit IIC [Clostridium estertheticum]